MSPAATHSAEYKQAVWAERAATTLFFLNGLVIGSFLPRLAELRDSLAIDDDVVGRALMGMGLGGLIGSFACGVLASRLGTRWLATVGGTALMVLLPLVAYGGGAWALFGALFALGIADATVDIGMNAQVVHAQSLLGRSTINRVHGMWSLGSLAGGLLGTLAASMSIGLGAQLLGFSAFGLVCTAWAAGKLLPFDAPTTHTDRPKRPVSGAALILGGVALATAVLEGSTAEWSAIMLVDEHGASSGQAGLGFVLFSGAMLVSRLSADRVVAAVGSRTTLIAGSTLVAIGAATIVLAPDLWLTLVGYAITGIGIAPLFPLLYETAAQGGQDSAGTGLAVMSGGMRIGFLSAPLLIGAIAASTNLRLALAIVLGIAAVVSLANAVRQPVAA